MELGFYVLLAYFAFWIVIGVFGLMLQTKDFYKHHPHS